MMGVEEGVSGEVDDTIARQPPPENHVAVRRKAHGGETLRRRHKREDLFGLPFRGRESEEASPNIGALQGQRGGRGCHRGSSQAGIAGTKNRISHDRHLVWCWPTTGLSTPHEGEN